jgi:hypothetical protein
MKVRDLGFWVFDLRTLCHEPNRQLLARVLSKSVNTIERLGKDIRFFLQAFVSASRYPRGLTERGIPLKLHSPSLLGRLNMETTPQDTQNDSQVPAQDTQNSHKHKPPSRQAYLGLFIYGGVPLPDIPAELIWPLDRGSYLYWP